MCKHVPIQGTTCLRHWLFSLKIELDILRIRSWKELITIGAQTTWLAYDDILPNENQTLILLEIKQSNITKYMEGYTFQQFFFLLHYICRIHNMDFLLSTTNCFPYTNTRVNNYPQTISLKGLNPLLTTCINIFFF